MTLSLSQSRDEYYSFSKTASELNRKLAFAGVAIVWVFRSGESSEELGITGRLLVVGGLFVLSLAADLLHYAVSAIAWGIFSRRKELGGAVPEDEFVAPRWINWSGIGLWTSKLVLSLAAYLILAVELFSRR